MPDIPWQVFAFPFLFVGVIAFAAVYKWLEVRAAANWSSTTGKVVASGVQARKVKTFDDNKHGGRGEEKRNFANVVYEYQVSGYTFRNNRISIGEDLGNFEVAETIARYPVGTTVTVYYNPRRPREAVLERDVPKGMWGCVIWMVFGGTALILIGFYGFNQITDYMRGVLSIPKRAPLVVALVTFGIVSCWIGLAIRKHEREAKRWARVPARIDRSEVETFRGTMSKSNTVQTLYRPLIRYSYSYNGLNYSGDQASLNAKVTANFASVAKRKVAKFPAGSTVTIYVNPKNPAESVLKPSSFGLLLAVIPTAILWGMAWFVSQVP